MSHTVSTHSSDPAPFARARPFPVLETGNGSFPEAVYRVTIDTDKPGQSIRVAHAVENAPLLQRWIADGAVRFLCATSAPISAYRRVSKSDTPEHIVEWNRDDLGSHPLFTPMLVLKQETEHVVDAQADGLNALWHGRQLQLPKAARVAVGSTFVLQGGIQGLLRLRLVEDLPAGSFRVKTDTTADLMFLVEVAPDLHAYLAEQRPGPTRGNIMTHVVSAALRVLQREYGQEENEEIENSDRNLQALANTFKDNNCPHWKSNDFRPEEVASRMYPHRVAEEGPDG